MGTYPPIQLEILSEVTRYHHSASFRHPACLVHLTHESVDYRHTCHSLFPPLDRDIVLLKLILGSIVDTVRLKDGIASV